MNSKKRTRILVTAGPTREWLDPIRFMSNPSTGVMGYEIARQANKLKHKVTLISGPTFLEPPKGVRFIGIESAEDLKKILQKEFSKHDLLFMTAAIGDYTPIKISKQKIKRVSSLSIKLKQTPDILESVAKKKKKSQTVIGFCLETEKLLENAKKKLKKKHCDYIVANYLGKSNQPFGSGMTEVVLLDSDGVKQEFKQTSKPVLAKKLIQEVLR